MLKEGDSSHRKFLKTATSYKVGGIFPKHIQLLPNTEFTSFEWLFESEKGAVLFFLSEYCAACNIEPAIQFIKRYQKFNYVLFNEGSVQEKIVDSANVKIYESDLDKLFAQLNVSTIPFVLVLNKVGQVVASSIFNELKHIEAVTAPLIKVYYRDEVG